jgi:uncharacterized protein YjbI with pentapeptide repeats
LHGLDLRDARVAGSDLRNANLAGANLSRATLCVIDRDGADSGNRIQCADLSGADLKGTDLRGALVCSNSKAPNGCRPVTALELRSRAHADLSGALAPSN